MKNNINIGIAGLGTVGGGVVKIINQNAEALYKKSGKRFVIRAVSAKNRNQNRGFTLDNNVIWYDNPLSMAQDSEIDMIVELIGGSDGVAYELCEYSIKHGKDFVTANKALIAKHGINLAKQAEEMGVAIAFEAAVAGGIPIIKTIKEGLVANNIKNLAGIINGTCNYILTTMEDSGRNFDDVLKEAQKLGYAEADPSFDVDGIDTAHKLCILSSLAFTSPVDFSSVYIEGIRDIAIQDICYAADFGYKIKLLGIASIQGPSITQNVYPCLVPINHPLAKVSGVNNAIFIDANPLGKLTLEGPGAGEGATASAVVADIIDLVSGRRTFTFGVPVANLAMKLTSKITNHSGEYYLRVTVLDETGILAGISEILSNEGISVESMVQKPVKKGENANIVVITHNCNERSIQNAVEKIKKIKGVVDKPKVLRIM